MTKYNKLIFISISAILLFAVMANIFLLSLWKGHSDKYYKIEINRAYNNFLENGIVDDIDDYQYIQRIVYLSASAGDYEIKEFYEDSSMPYLIKTLGDDAVTGYLKFSYSTDTKDDSTLAQAIINASIILAGIYVIFILFYIKSQIINPFNKLSNLPYELSKGHLTPALKESKSKYFGRFIWGLDLLRENLEEQKSRQLALNKEKKSIVLSISHDIKTPLSAIRLYSKALSEDLYDNIERKHEIIRNIEKKADEIEHFVGGIIKSSREDFLNLEVNNTEFYLADLIHGLQDYYEDKLRYISCRFIVEDYENCLVYGDIDRAREVLENIMENAIKYGDGKSISIATANEEDAQLLTVTNTGTPLPSKEMVHMWESFWRGSNVRDRSGSGLGLYISRSLMTLMKGDIFARNNLNSMSFTIVFKKL